MSLWRNFVAGCLWFTLIISPRMIGAAEIDQNSLLGSWKFHFTWGGLVDDAGSLLAKQTGNRIEFTCTDCDTPEFLRGTINGNGQINWEYWAESGMQGTCDND